MISLNYLANKTRPNIAYAVGGLSRYTNNPNQEHWNALERIFKYLKGILNYGLHYIGYPSVLEGYTNANWIADTDETKSTSGYLFMLARGAIDWKSCRQKIIARSTMEAESIVLDSAANQAT